MHTSGTRMRTSALACCALALLALAAVGRPAAALLPPLRITANLNAGFSGVINQAMQAYQLDHPELIGEAVSFSGHSGLAAAEAAMTSGNFDFVVASSSVSDVYAASNPNVRSYPIMASPLVPTYSLPISVGTAKLRLTTVAICKMQRGAILYWNDTEIQATNPGLVLPYEPVTWVQYGYVSDVHTATTRLCHKADAGWTLGVTDWPQFSRPNFVGISLTQTAGGGHTAYVVAHPFSIGWAVYGSASMADLVNAAGNIVAPTSSTVGQAFLEMASNGILPGGKGFDLSNALGAFAWPANFQAWLWLDIAAVRSTCLAKATVLRFLLWYYTSPVVAKLAANSQQTPPPELYLSTSDLLNRIRREILCDGASLVGVDSTSAYIQGNSIVATPINFLTTLYAQRDTTYSYSFKRLGDALALQRISAGEIDMAIVDPIALTAAEIDMFQAPTITYDAQRNPTERAGGMILPGFLVGVAPTFFLPSAITALYATRTASNDQGLPALYPLLLTLDVAAAIYLGLINEWTDPRLTAINPQLTAYFTRSGAPTRLRTVVCCTDASDPLVATTILAYQLTRSATGRGLLGASAPVTVTAKTIWSVAAAANPGITGNQTIVSKEGYAAGTMNLQPGTISYRLISGATSSQTSDFRMQIMTATGATEVYAPVWQSMQQCLASIMKPGDSPEQQYAAFAPFLEDAKSTQDFSFTPYVCWPFTSLSSIAVARSFSSATDVGANSQSKTSALTLTSSTAIKSACPRAQKNLELLHWIQTSYVVGIAAHNSGVFRIADIMQRNVVDKLNTATCDGKTILIVLPIWWQLASGVTIFTAVAAIIMMIVCAATVAGLYAYRAHSAIRGASPLFLAQVAVGLALMSLGLIFWAAPDATDDSCQAFQWLSNLGFTLSFAPLFAKTWRIYQIFSAKRIKVVKITNMRLIWVVGAMIATELLVLSIWSGVSPLQPVVFERDTQQADGAIQLLKHCAVQGQGTGFLAVEGSLKGLLLFGGSLMGFSTRKVSASFNESQTIAWAIYNVVFSGLIVAAILISIDTMGDALVTIVMVLFLWVIVMTWACIFLPKISLVLYGEEKRVGVAGTSSAGSHTSANSITWASITGMSVHQLNVYRGQLQTQLEKVTRALGLSARKKDMEGAVLMSGGNRVMVHTQHSGGQLQQPQTLPRLSKDRERAISDENANGANGGEVQLGLRPAGTSTLRKAPSQEPSSPPGSVPRARIQTFASGSLTNTTTNGGYFAPAPGGRTGSAAPGAATGTTPTVGSVSAARYSVDSVTKIGSVARRPGGPANNRVISLQTHSSNTADSAQMIQPITVAASDSSMPLAVDGAMGDVEAIGSLPAGSPVDADADAPLPSPSGTHRSSGPPSPVFPQLPMQPDEVASIPAADADAASASVNSSSASPASPVRVAMSHAIKPSSRSAAAAI